GFRLGHYSRTGPPLRNGLSPGSIHNRTQEKSSRTRRSAGSNLWGTVVPTGCEYAPMRLPDIDLSQLADDLPDAALLSRFLTDRDEVALAGLVHRHGPMVLGVGRRVLGDAHAAEDAFQATFLVLVRRATDAARDRLGPWLYGVAHRTALKARAASLRRTARE